MFFIIGILIGLNLGIRVVMGEVRELQVKGHVSTRGRARLTFGDIASVSLRGGVFLLVPVLIGFGLDWAFGTTVGDLFG